MPVRQPNVAPEYEDCKRLALESGMPLAQVYQLVVRAVLNLKLDRRQVLISHLPVPQHRGPRSQSYDHSHDHSHDHSTITPMIIPMITPTIIP